MCLHSEVPVVAFLRLTHLRFASLVVVLGRGWRRDQGAVHEGPFAHRQPLAGKVALDLIEDPARQRILFEQTAKFEQCRRLRRRLMREVDTDKRAPTGYRRSRPRSLRPTGQDNVERCTCAASASDQSAGDRDQRLSDSAVTMPPPGPPTASPRRSRPGNAHAASATSSWRNRRRKSSFALSCRCANAIRHRVQFNSLRARPR